MNFDECMKATINDSVENALERMKTLNAEDRYNLLCEWGEFLFCDPMEEDILIVPSSET